MTEEEVALEAAHAAAALLAERPSRVDRKGAVDLVTELDLAAEARIREVLERHTPEVPVLGEEGGGSDAGTRWVVDPIDGTTNFVHGFPYYAVSIGLEVDGEPHVGVVLDPVRRRAYRATRGRGAWLDGTRLRVSEVEDLGSSLLATGFGYDHRERAHVYAARVQVALTHGQGLRRGGAAALDLAHVACGALDGYFEYDLGRWDAAAGLVLVREAGGRVTPCPGAALGDRPSPLATNGRIHDALFEALEALG